MVANSLTWDCVNWKCSEKDSPIRFNECVISVFDGCHCNMKYCLLEAHAGMKIKLLQQNGSKLFLSRAKIASFDAIRRSIENYF